MAATAAGLALGAAEPTALRLESLARFRGVRRRQEARLSQPLLTVIEDFGHHPTALAETLRSFRGRFPNATLTAVFEPRSNTACRREMQDGFRHALAEADEVYLGPVNRPEKLKDAERFDPAVVVRQLTELGRQASAYPTNAALCDELVAQTLPAGGKARLVVFFSNGSFDGIIERYVNSANKAASGR
jgi:UDP-N-acetylmuramate: L-alanyl-gamma-D-glutamyl-meso-diaminopimelate ligase